MSQVSQQGSQGEGPAAAGGRGHAARHAQPAGNPAHDGRLPGPSPNNKPSSCSTLQSPVPHLYCQYTRGTLTHASPRKLRRKRSALRPSLMLRGRGDGRNGQARMDKCVDDAKTGCSVACDVSRGSCASVAAQPPPWRPPASCWCAAAGWVVVRRLKTH